MDTADSLADPAYFDPVRGHRRATRMQTKAGPARSDLFYSGLPWQHAL
jgi:hypothetical protein